MVLQVEACCVHFEKCGNMWIHKINRRQEHACVVLTAKVVRTQHENPSQAHAS